MCVMQLGWQGAASTCKYAVRTVYRQCPHDPHASNRVKKRENNPNKMKASYSRNAKSSSVTYVSSPAPAPVGPYTPSPPLGSTAP